MKIKSLILGSLLVGLVSCAPTNHKAQNSAQEENNGVVNIYSSRHYDTDLRLYSDFTDQTGIRVNRIEAKSNALLERIKSEGDLSPADLLITVDAGVFWRAEQDEILQPVSSDILERRVPSHLRHPQGLWYGLSKRARVMIYNKDKGRPEGLETYEDLSEPAHNNSVCMRSSGNIYNISLLSSIIANDGSEKAKAWAQGMVSNFARKAQSNDSGQIEAVAAGICKASLVNTYYLARYARSDEPQKQEIFKSLGIIFPNQSGRGTHINISGAGLTRHAPNPENALRFLEYLTSESAQRYFANGNNEYPIVDLGSGSSAVQALGTFKEDQLNVGELGKNQSQAIAIYNEAGWP